MRLCVSDCNGGSDNCNDASEAQHCLSKCAGQKQDEGRWSKENIDSGSFKSLFDGKSLPTRINHSDVKRTLHNLFSASLTPANAQTSPINLAQ